MSVTSALLSCCFLGIALAKTEAEVKHWFLERGVLCMKDYPITDEEFALMDKHKVPDSTNAKCFIACIFKKVSWMDDKGMFLEENAVKTADQYTAGEPVKMENAKKLFELCKTGSQSM